MNPQLRTNLLAFVRAYHVESTYGCRPETSPSAYALAADANDAVLGASNGDALSIADGGLRIALDNFIAADRACVSAAHSDEAWAARTIARSRLFVAAIAAFAREGVEIEREVEPLPPLPAMRRVSQGDEPAPTGGEERAA